MKNHLLSHLSSQPVPGLQQARSHSDEEQKPQQHQTLLEQALRDDKPPRIDFFTDKPHSTQQHRFQRSKKRMQVGLI